MSLKNSNDTIGNRTRVLPTCSAVSETCAPPLAPTYHSYIYIWDNYIIIIIMFMKGLACFLFLDPQNEVGPSNSSSAYYLCTKSSKTHLAFQSLFITWCTNSLTFNNCTLYPHCIYVFCIYLRTNSDLCHLQHKLIGFYNQMKSVYSAVWTGSLNTAVCASYLKG